MTEQVNIPFRDKPVKRRYMWRDVQRRAARYGIPFDRVPTYPVDPDLLANRIGVIVRGQYDRETDAARKMGIFGSPTFAVGDEIFWGDDRLQDALEWLESHAA